MFHKLFTIIIIFIIFGHFIHSVPYHDFNELENNLGNLDNLFFSTISKELQSKLKDNPLRDTLTFAISPIWLEFILLILSIGSGGTTMTEIDNVTEIHSSLLEKVLLVKNIHKNIPPSNQFFKYEINNFIFINDLINMNLGYCDMIENSAKMFMNYIHVDDNDISDKINKMIRKKIKRRMRDIFDEDDLKGNETSLVLASSIYYKNKWLYSPTVLNGTLNFQVKENVSEKVEMFRINGFMSYTEIKDWDAKVVDIPYVTENTSMLIFLPNDITGLMNMEEKIMNQKFIIKHLDKLMNKTAVAITLPKYTLETTIMLPSKLYKMGIKNLFTNNAELDNMIFQKNIPVTNIVQHLKLWANDGRGSFKDTGDEEFPKPEKIIIVDHPFFFILKVNKMAFMMGHFSI